MKRDTNVLDVLTLYRCMCVDVGVDYSTRKYILQRLAVEGISFVTKVLPNLAKVIILGIDLGNFPKARALLGFTSIKWQGKSLRYFRSFLNVIFTPDGLLNTDKVAVGHALKKVRQLCELLYKLVEKPTRRMEIDSWKEYLQIDKELPVVNTLDDYGNYLIQKMRGNVRFYGLNANVDEILKDFSPRYTSGSFSQADIIEDVGAVINPYSFKLLDERWIGNIDGLRQITFFRKYPRALRRTTFRRNVKVCTPCYKNLIKKGRDRVSRFSLVPKDSRGPRIISMEPIHALPYQMVYFDYMTSRLQQVTGGRINFTDQSVNQELSLVGSIERNWDTSDMEKGSDRVLFSRLEYLLSDQCPGLLALINAFRSSEVINTKMTEGEANYYKLPRRHKLNKLAGMGSGFTFPSMAFLIHLAVCTMATLLTGIPYKRAMRLVYVYGDDLITPHDWNWFVPRALRYSGFKLNSSKSYSRGYFRESCGKDYYYGIETQPIRLKKVYRRPYVSGTTPLRGIKASSVAGPLYKVYDIESLCDFTTQMFNMGYNRTFSFMYDQITTILGFAPPVTDECSPIIGLAIGQPSIEDGVGLQRVSPKDRQGAFSDEKLYTIALRSERAKRPEPPALNSTPIYKLVDLREKPYLVHAATLDAEVYLAPGAVKFRAV